VDPSMSEALGCSTHNRCCLGLREQQAALMRGIYLHASRTLIFLRPGTVEADLVAIFMGSPNYSTDVENIRALLQLMERSHLRRV
jgi:hypothetical protein